MIANIANCSGCGKVFVKGINDVCPDCMKDVEEKYEKCLAYLRENKSANINELSKETGASIKQITRFIKEGRLSLADAPNLEYPCELCGILIKEGNYCLSCVEKSRKVLSEQLRAGTKDKPASKKSPGFEFRSE